MPFFGRVEHEAVYYLTRKRRSASRRRRRCGTTATTSPRSRSSAAGWPSGPRRRGATILPETAGEKLLVDHGRVGRRPHRRQGPRPGRRGARELRAGLRHAGPGHGAGRGDPGPPDRRRARPVRPPGREPAGLGARASRRSGRSRKPLDRVIHTMGWPLRGGEVPGVRRLLHLPDGRDMVTLGMVVGLDYRDAELSVHDLLQELKTHPLVARRSSTAASGSPGARRRSPRAASCRCPKRLHVAGPADRRRRRRARERARAEGDPLRRRVRHAGRRGRLRGAAARRDAGTAGRARRLRRGAARELRLERPARRCATCGRRSAAGSGSAARIAGAMTASRGALPARRLDSSRRTPSRAARGPTAPRRYPRPTASSPSTSSRASS